MTTNNEPRKNTFVTVNEQQNIDLTLLSLDELIKLSNAVEAEIDNRDDSLDLDEIPTDIEVDDSEYFTTPDPEVEKFAEENNLIDETQRIKAELEQLKAIPDIDKTVLQMQRQSHLREQLISLPVSEADVIIESARKLNAQMEASINRIDSMML